MKEFHLAIGNPAAAGQGARGDAELAAEVERELAEHAIIIYGKGTKAQPLCGFTIETMEFFDQFGYPYELVNALEDPAKREYLSKTTEWPTLPKVFINGAFYGDTDILGPMHEKGELAPLLAQVFEDRKAAES